jgi:hypothetical protein
MISRILKKLLGRDAITIPDPADYDLRPVRSFHTKVVGVTKKNEDGRKRQEVIAGCKVGELVLLIRENENPYDSNAIAVYHSSRNKIGFIAADLAERLAPDMDSGQTISARVSDLTGGTPEKPSRGVNLEIVIFQR